MLCTEKFTKIIVDAYSNFMKNYETKKYAPILFYDSGVGGLSTLFSAYSLMPNENFVYFADQKNNPYGNKTKKQLKQIIISNIKNLINIWKPKAIVLACNTATATAISTLRKMYPHLLIIGTEPAIRPAIQSGAKNILVLGTKATILHSGLINLFKHNYGNIYFKSMINLAYYIENKDKNLIDIKNYLIEQLNSYKNKIDAVVLGCTHYVLIKPVIEDILEVQSFNGNLGVARRLNQCLELLNCKNEFGGHIIYISSLINKSEELNKIFNSLKGDGYLCVE